MKNTLKKLLLAFTVITSLTSAITTQAASKPASPKNLKVQEGSYYSYWNEHRAKLKKQGIQEGDVYDAIISWNSVSNAKGYEIIIYWDDEYDAGISKVTVTKTGSNTYKYIMKDQGPYTYHRTIDKNEKDFITKKTHGKTFTKTGLSFQINGNGSWIRIAKLKIKSFKLVNGKKIYSNEVSKTLHK